MQRRAADAVHHRMKRLARRIRRRRVRPMRRHFAVRLLHGLRPRAVVVPQLVRREVFRREPRAGLEADHLEAGLRERKRGDASGRAHADDDDIGRFQISGHVALPSRTSRSRRPSDGSGLHGARHALIGGRHVEPHTRIANQIPADEVRVAAIGRIAERALNRVRAHEREERRLLERREHGVLFCRREARRIADRSVRGRRHRLRRGRLGVRVARGREPSAERAIDVLRRARLGGAGAALVGRDDARAHRGQCRRF